jgi:hypothetical protein
MIEVYELLSDYMMMLDVLSANHLYMMAFVCKIFFVTVNQCIWI